MTNFTFPYFGEIDLNNLQEDYETKIRINNVEVDLHFENNSINIAKAQTIKNVLENLTDFDIQNKTYIENDYHDEENSTVKEYLEFHLEELDNKILAEFIDFEDQNSNPEKQLLKKLKLASIGFYPDDSDNFAVFDYTIDKKITNYLIVVNTDENNNLDDITWES